MFPEKNWWRCILLWISPYLFDSETSSWNSTAVFLFHLFHWSMKALEVPDGSGPSSLADLPAQAASLQKCSGEIFLASFSWKHIDDGKSTDRYSLRHLRHFQIREWPIYTAELVHFSISWSFHVELTYVCPQFSIVPCEGGKQNHLLAENDMCIYMLWVVVSCCELFFECEAEAVTPGKEHAASVESDR